MRVLLVVFSIMVANVVIRIAGAQAPAPARESPLACDRTALSSAARKRHFDELGPALRSKAKGSREIRNGYEFEFSPDPATVALVAEWAAGEHRCCPFFDIDLRLERENGSLWLRLTGREGVKQFIAADFSRWFTK